MLPTRAYWWRPGLLAPHYGRGLSLAAPDEMRAFLARPAGARFLHGAAWETWDCGSLTDVGLSLRATVPVNPELGERAADEALPFLYNVQPWQAAYPIAPRGWVNGRVTGTAGYARALLRVPRRVHGDAAGAMTGLGLLGEGVGGAALHWKRKTDTDWRMQGVSNGGGWTVGPTAEDDPLTGVTELDLRLSIGTDVGGEAEVALQRLVGASWADVLRGSVGYERNADLLPAICHLPNAADAPPDAYAADLAVFECYPFDPFVAQVMPVPAHLGSLDLAYMGKNVALMGHEGYEVVPGMGWGIRTGIRTLGVATSIVGLIIPGSVATDPADWFPPGAFTLLCDVYIEDPAQDNRMIVIVGNTTQVPYWWLTLDGSFLITLHVHDPAGANHHLPTVPIPTGACQVGVRHDGATRWDVVLNGHVVGTMHQEPARLLTILTTGNPGSRTMEAVRGDMSAWASALTDAQLLEAYGDLLSQRILNPSFEDAGDRAGAADQWEWNSQARASAAAAFLKKLDAVAYDPSYDSFEEQAGGGLRPVVWTLGTAYPAPFAPGATPYEPFGGAGWAAWPDRGWPMEWGTGIAASFAGAPITAPQPFEEFDGGWIPLPFADAPAGPLVLRPTYPVRIVRERADRVGLLAYNFTLAAWHGIDLHLPPGTYADQAALKIVLDAALSWVPGDFAVVTDVEGDALSIRPAAEDVVAIVALPPGIGADRGDARAAVGIPALDATLTVIPPGVAAGWRCSPLLTLWYAGWDGRPWLRDVGASFDGDHAEDFERGWGNDDFRYETPNHRVWEANLVSQFITLHGAHAADFPASSPFAWVGNALNGANYTVDHATEPGGTVIYPNEAFPSSNDDGYLYQHAAAAPFASGAPGPPLVETFFNGPPVILWPTDVLT